MGLLSSTLLEEFAMKLTRNPRPAKRPDDPTSFVVVSRPRLPPRVHWTNCGAETRPGGSSTRHAEYPDGVAPCQTCARSQPLSPGLAAWVAGSLANPLVTLRTTVQTAA